MRTDRRYTRVRDMLTVPEMPRTPDGGIETCHPCQRSIYFAGSYLDLLIKHVKGHAEQARGE